MPDAVCFDFGGTLEADGVPCGTRCFRAYRASGGGRVALDAFQAIYRESDRALAALPGVARLGFRATLEAQARILRALLPDGDAVDADAVARALYADARAVARRNRRVLDALRRAGARLGVVSNFTGNLARCLDELGLLEPLDVVVDSGAVGPSKPDAAIYGLALARLDAAPERTWMVGDNPVADVRAAGALGLSTCWIAPPERAPVPGCTPTARIARLPELLALFGLDDAATTGRRRAPAQRDRTCTG